MPDNPDQFSPEIIREAILIFCDAIDAATTQLRTNLKAQPFKRAEIPKAKIDLSQLPWTLILAPDNPKGPWEKTTERSNPVYAELYKILEPKSPIPIDGYLCWLSREKDYIARRAFKKKVP
jgi:hypothetical protein